MAAEQNALKRKIDELNRLAWEVRVSDSDNAFKSSTEAVGLSRKLNYANGLANGLTLKGFGYIRKSDFNEASLCLNEALAIYRSSNDLRGLAVVYEYLGIIQRYTGDAAAALESIFKALDLSRQTNFADNEITNLYQLGVTYRHLAEYEKALDYLFNSLSLARSSQFSLMEAYNLHVIGSIYFETGDYPQALRYYKQGLIIRQKADDKWGEAGSLDNIGFTYVKLNDYQQAIDHCQKSLEITRSGGDKKGQANALIHLAEIYKQINEPAKAVAFSNESLAIRKTSGDKRGVAEILLFLTDLHKADDENSSNILLHLSEVLKIAEEIKANDLLSKMHYRLYEHYKGNGNFEDAIIQLELHFGAEEKLHKDTINQKVVNLEITYKAEEAKKEAEAIRLKNEELTRLNAEIEKQKNRLVETLAELKATQANLIQKEKMASLGELTAGIAHEIQNPLNFVNNFSEVSNELIKEIQDERRKSKDERDEGLEDELLTDISQNLEKINHHGKRADAIVKGMLEHSGKSAGEKVPTDINALADEYLRLSYHGMRAKDKSFNSDFKTDFDPNLPKIDVIPQDIGRVLLNIINNAFQACTMKDLPGLVEDDKRNLEGLSPTVTVSTKNLGDRIQITVKDNGPGIPNAIKDKIFQPFFTTKPTGQGTGLGLSLSYDIVKAHGGELQVKSDQHGSKFSITINL
ncbi:hypothetical protein BH23BAC2_BH23BAC2_04350 [soil metagenome]